jgi:hypothetical protein
VVGVLIDHGLVGIPEPVIAEVGERDAEEVVVKREALLSLSDGLPDRCANLQPSAVRAKLAVSSTREFCSTVLQ